MNPEASTTKDTFSGEKGRKFMQISFETIKLPAQFKSPFQIKTVVADQAQTSPLLFAKPNVVYPLKVSQVFRMPPPGLKLNPNAVIRFELL